MILEVFFQPKRFHDSWSWVELSKAAQFTPCITTSATKKRWWVIVVGDSLLRGRGTHLPNYSSLERSLLLTRGSHQGSPRDCQVSYSLMTYRCCCFMWAPRSSLSSSEGLKSSGSSTKVLRITGGSFISPPAQREGDWKGHWNLANQEVVAGLVATDGGVGCLNGRTHFEKSGLMGCTVREREGHLCS